jgi:hypothetical protein
MLMVNIMAVISASSSAADFIYRHRRMMFSMMLLVVFKAVTMKNVVFWDVAPRVSCRNRRFGGMRRLHHQNEKNQGANK